MGGFEKPLERHISFAEIQAYCDLHQFDDDDRAQIVATVEALDQIWLNRVEIKKNGYNGEFHE